MKSHESQMGKIEWRSVKNYFADLNCASYLPAIIIIEPATHLRACMIGFIASVLLFLILFPILHLLEMLNTQENDRRNTRILFRHRTWILMLLMLSVRTFFPTVRDIQRRVST